MSWLNSRKRKIYSENSIDSSQEKHQKSHVKNKSFVIESKYIDYQGRDHPWHVWKKYKTEKDRDMAFVNMKRKETNKNGFGICFKFRISVDTS